MTLLLYRGVMRMYDFDNNLSLSWSEWFIYLTEVGMNVWRLKRHLLHQAKFHEHGGSAMMH